MADASLLPTDVWHIIIKYLSLADARSGKLVCRQWFHWLRPRVDELEREALINMVVFDEKSLRPHWTGEFPVLSSCIRRFYR